MACRQEGVNQMKPDYKNWVPKSMVLGLFCGAVVCAIAAIAVGFLMGAGTLKTILLIVLILAALIFCAFTVWVYALHKTFDYNGSRKMAKTIIEGTATYVSIPDDGVGLDVGCGSGALTIACAKRNPKARMVGCDIWSGAYKAVFTKKVCEKNAQAEGVSNVSFEEGNAIHLPFADESFDAVTSNYVYHNIAGQDKQKLLLETLRVLKKGGTFALHDIFSKAKYGDMQVFLDKLREMGYEKVELIDTTNGMFMSPAEAKWMALSGSALLVGKK